jgi:hypothetical protein
MEAHLNLSISPVRGRAPLARQQLPDALSVGDLLQTTSNIFSSGSWTEQQELNHAAFILGAEKTASGWMPVAAIGKTAVLIATAEKQDARMPRSIDLINLGLTAARTGFELTKGSAVVITPSPQVWIDLLPELNPVDKTKKERPR